MSPTNMNGEKAWSLKWDWVLTTWEKSLHKIKILYILCKHMCQGAKKEEGSQILKIKEGFLGEIVSTLRPERNELKLSG